MTSLKDRARALHQRLGLKYRFDRQWRYARRFGVRQAREVRRSIWTRTGELVEVTVPGIPYPIALRAGTADASTLEKIFVWNGYDLDYPPDVRVVIDAGANIGVSAAFFATRFPAAMVIAIEPESSNWSLLLRNVAQFSNVTPVHAALWSEDTSLALSNPEDRVDSYRYSAAACGERVEALCMRTLLLKYGVAKVDVLKVDIEGAEAEVFAGKPAWVGDVRMFITELHGDAARTAFREATSSLTAHRYKNGEDEVVRVV